MEDLLEDSSLSSLLAGISNSTKFSHLCKTIYTLRNKYLARGVKNDQITQKIMSKLFNTKGPVVINWFSLKNTIEYQKIRNLVEMDPKTLELALAIQQEMIKMKKKKKHEKQTKDFTLDDMLDIFQYRLESSLNLDKNSSSSSSDSPSDFGESFWSPEHPGLSYYDSTIHNYNFDGIIKEQVKIGKRKPKKIIDTEDEIRSEINNDSKKKIKVPYKPSEKTENHLTNISTFLANEFYEPYKRTRENENGVVGSEKSKLFKL